MEFARNVLDPSFSHGLGVYVAPSMDIVNMSKIQGPTEATKPVQATPIHNAKSKVCVEAGLIDFLLAGKLLDGILEDIHTLLNHLFALVFPSGKVEGETSEESPIAGMSFAEILALVNKRQKEELSQLSLV